MEEHGGNIYEREIVLDYSVNVNPFGMPDAVKQAAMKGVLLSKQYPDLYKRNLTEGLSDLYQIDAKQIVTGNGAAELIYGIVFALNPKKALVVGPTFSEYEKALMVQKSKVIHYFAKAQNSYEAESDLLSKIEECKCNMVFLCNPNNPTGRLISPELLEDLITLCEEKGIYLVVDECFMELTTSESHSCRKRISSCKFLLILKAFTKSFAMPGLRLGFLFSANKAVAEKIRSVLPPWNVSIPAQLAGCAAIKERTYIKTCMDVLVKEREWMRDSLMEYGYHVYPSDTIFLLLEGPKNLQEFCLEHKILIRDAGSFAGIRRHTYRIGIKTRQENEKLLEILKKAAGEHTWLK